MPISINLMYWRLSSARRHFLIEQYSNLPQFGEKLVGTGCKIGTVRRVIENLPTKTVNELHALLLTIGHAKGLNGASQSIEGQAVGIDMHCLTLENTIIPHHGSQKVVAISMRGESTSVLVFLWLWRRQS